MARAAAIVLALPEALGSSVTLPLEMLSAAADYRRARRRPVDGDIYVAGLNRNPVSMAGGVTIKPTHRYDQIDNCRLLIVPSFWRHPDRQTRRYPELIAWLRQCHAAGTTLCAVGSGSFLVAASGLLDGRAATTHWHYFDDFAKRFPAVKLKRDFLLTESANIYCAGSVNSVADVIVHLIEQQVGAVAARAVENQFSPEVRREFYGRAWRDGSGDIHADETIARLQSWMARHYSEPVTLAMLCSQSGLGARTLHRRFVAATGQSPLKYVQTLRINAALELLRDTNLSVVEIATATGHSDSTQFCRHFRNYRNQTPGQYRRVVRSKLFTSGTSRQ